jgi:hypothetical protein
MEDPAEVWSNILQKIAAVDGHMEETVRQNFGVPVLLPGCVDSTPPTPSHLWTGDEVAAGVSALRMQQEFLRRYPGAKSFAKSFDAGRQNGLYNEAEISRFVSKLRQRVGEQKAGEHQAGILEHLLQENRSQGEWFCL